MGRKAKIKAIRNRLLKTSTGRYEKDVDAMEKIKEFQENPNFQLAFMDPSVPIFLFINEKSGETVILGNREAIPGMRKCLSQAIAETVYEQSEKASLN